MLQDATICALAEGISHQPLGEGEGAVVLKISSGQLFTCNDTTAAFLNVIDGERTFGEAVDELQRLYDVPREQLRGDLIELANNLIEDGVLSIVRN
jgi:pyrroloquinoline quinone biosynthesis protein D